MMMFRTISILEPFPILVVGSKTNFSKKSFFGSFRVPHLALPGFSGKEMGSAQTISDSSLEWEQVGCVEPLITQVQFSNDADGAVKTDDGYIAKCVDKHWWVSPACRDSISECAWTAI